MSRFREEMIYNRQSIRMKHGEVAKLTLKTESVDITMWYVIQVMTGTEESIKRQCEKLIDGEVLERCFIPYYEEKKKYQGNWHVNTRVLFPGYVFLVSEQLVELRMALHRVLGLTKLIGTGEEILPLSEQEVALLQKMGKDEQVVAMSVGFIEHDKVCILEGPLEGMEGCIKRIDRHKRKAWIEVELFGRIVEMCVGCEIVEKRGSN